MISSFFQRVSASRKVQSCTKVKWQQNNLSEGREMKTQYEYKHSRGRSSLPVELSYYRIDQSLHICSHILPFYRWEGWGMGRWNSLHKDSEMGNKDAKSHQTSLNLIIVSLHRRKASDKEHAKEHSHTENAISKEL